MTTEAQRPRRISFVATGLGVGGAEAMLYRVATRLDRSRFTPMVVSVMDDGEYGDRIRAAGIPVTSIGFTDRAPTPARLARLFRALQRQRPDAIMGWMYHGNFAAWLGRRWAAPDAGLAWNIRHSPYDLDDEGRLTRSLIRLGAPLSKRVDATVYVSDTSRRLHLARGYDPSTAVVIGNGIDPPPVATPEERAAVRAELGFGADDVVVVRVARFDPMKDHVGFLEAMIMAVEANPAIRVLLVGREASPENPVLAPLLADPRLAGRVVVLGERRDVGRVLTGVDILVSSSWAEGFPNVVLEAAVAGIPCVVTDVGASAEIAGDGGRVVAPRDPRALCDAVLEVAGLGRDGRIALGSLARAHASARHNLDDVAGKYADLLERLSRPRAERARGLFIPA